MKMKSLLSKSQETAATATVPPAAQTTEMTLTPVAPGNTTLGKLLSDRPLVDRVIETNGNSTPYLHAWWGTGNQQPIPGVKKGDLVLVTPTDQTRLEPPVKGFLCMARQYWCSRVPATGQVVRASLEMQPRGSNLDEEVEALLLVLSPAGVLLPVTWRTRKGACRGLVSCMQEQLAAATPEWVQQSEGHKVAAQLPSPWMRFVVEIDHRLEQPRRGGGNPYPVTSAVCRPIDPDSFSLLKTFLADDANQALLAEVFATHEAKLKEVDAKLMS
jgi:hypothetical protein